MELQAATLRGTAGPDPLPRGTATTRGALAAVALAVVLGMTPVFSAWGAQQQQGEAGDEVTEVVPNSGMMFFSELETGETVQVFPAARNIGQEDQSRHIFLYLPPLTLKRDSAGQVETLVTTTGGVRVEMRGASPRITNGLHQWLAVDGSLPAARRPGSRSVRPLPYHEIRIFDTDVVDEARWEAVYPTVADLIPVSQEWIPFVFRRRPGVSESAAEFIERLNDPVRSTRVDRGCGLRRPDRGPHHRLFHRQQVVRRGGESTLLR